MSSVFREKTVSQEAKQDQPPMKDNKPVSSPVDPDPPFTDYQGVKGKPFVVEHYELGEYWNDPMGSYEPEVNTIESYLKRRVEQGEIPDTAEAVKQELRDIEKITGLKKELRTSVKIGTIAAYTKFLLEAEGIKINARKYGNH